MEHLSAQRVLADVNEISLLDEFNGGGITSGTIGNTGWVETTSAAGTNSLQDGGAGRGAVFRLTTGAVSGNNKRIHRGLAANGAYITASHMDRFRWIVRIPTITTITVRLGLMQDVSAANGGTQGVFFDFDPAVAATWRTVTRLASTNTVVNGPTVVANNWYLLEAIKVATASNWELRINDVAIQTSNSNKPVGGLNFGALLQTGAASARSLDFDYAYFRAFSLTARFT